jgi:uncharacterized protein YciI
MMKYVSTSLVMLAGMVGAQTTPQHTRREMLVFVAMYERGSAWQEGRDVPEQPGFSEHVQYLYAHAEEIVAAGPFPMEPADRVIGLLVFQAHDQEAAEQCIAQDPGIRSGVFKATVRHWRVRRVRSVEMTPEGK